MTAVAQFPQGIDHPLVTVRNHAEALELYRRMGFAPSPVSYHPWGSVTSLMMFPSNFIELIGVDDPSKFGTNSVNGFCFDASWVNSLTAARKVSRWWRCTARTPMPIMGGWSRLDSTARGVLISAAE